MRGAVTLLLFLAALLVSGCSALDRESYSIVIKKKAHRYHELTELEKARLEDHRSSMRPPEYEDPAEEPDDRLPPPAIERKEHSWGEVHTLEPFQPFAWCYYHKSFHIPESLVAIAAAPVEAPLYLVGDIAAFAIIDAIRQLNEFLGITPPKEKKPDEKGERKK